MYGRVERIGLVNGIRDFSSWGKCITYVKL